jgi:glycine reductase complex component B subunit alpha and beta
VRLELASYPVHDVVLTDRTEYQDGVLRVDQAGVEARLVQDPALVSVRLSIARPGDRTRIIHVLDVLEPRCKLGRPGAAFPGVLGPADTAGDGRTSRLAGLALVQTGQFQRTEGLQMMRESIVDMSGPAAEIIPFSQTINLVASFEAAPGVGNAEFDHALRVASARLAEDLAHATAGQEPVEVQTQEQAQRRPDLPRVVWICLVQSLGLMEHTLVYGESTVGKLPMPMFPTEVLDGAVFSGNFLFACQRNRTYLYQNSTLLKELFALDGRELSLAGVIISPSSRHTLPEKELAAGFAAKTAAMLEANAAIITQEGGGHAGVDLMLVCNRCERVGIKTVLVNNEATDAAGTDTSFVYVVPEADAMVSTGKTEELIALPTMERVIGGEMLELEEVRQPAAEAFITSLRPLCCATSQMGETRLTVLQY